MSAVEWTPSMRLRRGVARATWLGLALVMAIGTATPVVAQTQSRAHDGRSLADESAAVRASFRAVWGEADAARWIEEHNAHLARGRSGSVPRIGYISLGDPTFGPQSAPELLLTGLREQGYDPGRTILVEWRYAENRQDAHARAAADLVNSPVDLIVAAAGPDALAVRQVSSTIPIVFISVADPIGAGLAATAERPGGNSTGFDNLPPQVARQRLELLREVVPGLARVGYFWNSANPAQAQGLHDTQAAAAELGLTLQILELRSADDLEATFAAATSSGVQAVVNPGEPLVLNVPAQRARILAFAERARLPMLAPRAYVENGGLMYFGPNSLDNNRRASTYIDRILKGARPGDLPLSVTERIEMLFNLKAAQAIGLTVPQAVLARATEVIR